MRKELKIPTLESITLEKFQILSKYYELNGDNYASDQYMVSVLYGMPLKEVRAIKKTTLDTIIDEVKKTLSEEPQLVTRFTIDGIDYGFIPNLEEMSAGEYADLEKYIGEVDNFHKALAVLYRPITKEFQKKYLIEEYRGTGERANIMLNTSLSVFRSAMVFFWNLEKELLNASMDFITKTTTELATSHRKGSTSKNGDGTLPSTELLEEYSRILKEQQRQMFTKSSPI